MSITVSEEGTYKEATGMWVSMGGAWQEVQTGGGGTPPSSAAIALLDLALDDQLTVSWGNAVVTIPTPVAYEIAFGATSDPYVLPTEWHVVATVDFIEGPLFQYTWTGADPGRAPGLFTYGMVTAVSDEGRSSPTYTNPVMADPLPTAVVALGGVWASITENYLFWDEPVEMDDLIEYVVHYSTTGEIVNVGEGTLLGTVQRGLTSYTHTKAAAEQEIPLWYSVFPRRADGLTGPHETQMVVKGEVPPPTSFSAVGTSPSTMAVSWRPPLYPVDATGYRLVFRADTYPVGPDDPAATVLLDNASLDTLTYSHTGLAAQTSYYYLIACTQPDGGYGLGATDIGTTSKPPPPLPDYVANYDITPGILWCWYYVSWSVPANTSEISFYDMRCAPNSAPGGGGTLARTVFHQAGTVHYTRTLYMTYVTAQTMGISVNATNGAGAGPWANGTSALGGFAASLCEGFRSQKPGVYDPAPGTIEELGPQWVEDFERITGFQAPRDVDEAWDIVAEMIESDEPDDDNWWTRICFALEVPLWMDKPSEDAWNRADAIRLSPRTIEILNYWDEVLPEIVNEHDKDTAVLALMECMSALGTTW